LKKKERKKERKKISKHKTKEKKDFFFGKTKYERQKTMKLLWLLA
jgi:hypothetical protein